MSTGLFFVLRERMRMTFLISVSRPITGSSSLSRARLTRSVPYFVSASYVLSGLSPVTGEVLTFASSVVNAVLVMP